MQRAALRTSRKQLPPLENSVEGTTQHVSASIFRILYSDTYGSSTWD